MVELNIQYKNIVLADGDTQRIKVSHKDIARMELTDSFSQFDPSYVSFIYFRSN
jgi:hypothetical protein